MTENRSYDYIQSQGHLGHMTPRWTSHMTEEIRLLKVGKFFVKIVISPQIKELWPKKFFCK